MSFLLDKLQEIKGQKRDRSQATPEECATCKKVTGSVFTIAGPIFLYMAKYDKKVSPGVGVFFGVCALGVGIHQLYSGFTLEKQIENKQNS